MAEETIKTNVRLDASEAQQQIAKLNAIASDTTNTLEERLAAKNKQVELQNKLSKQTISQLQKEVNNLSGVVGKEKELQKAVEKLEKAKLKALKTDLTLEKQSKKLTQSRDKEAEETRKSSTAIGSLDNATGGLITRFKALAANPIVLLLTALVGVFQALKAAVNRSEKATESFAKVGAFLEGVFNGLIAALTPLVEFLGEALVFAIEKPQQAWDSFVSTLETGYNFIKKQVVDRFQGSWNILSGNFEKGVLKMRIAWNDFTGDADEAQQLRDELDEVNKKIKEGEELITGANEAIISVYNDVKEAVTDYADTAVKEYQKAEAASIKLANSEKALRLNTIELEKIKLESLRNAEKERQVRDDISLSIEERIAANTRLGKILDEQTRKELKLAQDNLAIEKLKLESEGRTIENLEAVSNAELKILEIRERINGQRSEQLVNEQALLKEGKDAEIADAEAVAAYKKSLRDAEQKSREEQIEQEAQDRLAELEKLKVDSEEKTEIEKQIETLRREALRELKAEQDAIDLEAQLEQDEIDLQRKRDKNEVELQDELAYLEARRIQEVSQEGLRQSEIDAINKKYGAEKQKFLDAEEKANKDKDKAVFDSAVNMAGEAFGISQELAVARMIMNAPEAISNVWTQAAKKPTLPGVILHGTVGTATVVAPIIKGLAAIKKAKFSKRRGGSAPSGSISATATTGATSAVTTSERETVSDLNNNQSTQGLNSISTNATQNAAASATASQSSQVVFEEGSFNDFNSQIEFRDDLTTID